MKQSKVETTNVNASIYQGFKRLRKAMEKLADGVDMEKISEKSSKSDHYIKVAFRLEELQETGERKRLVKKLAKFFDARGFEIKRKGVDIIARKQVKIGDNALRARVRYMPERNVVHIRTFG